MVELKCELATVAHTNPAPLGQFFSHPVVHDALQAKDIDTAFLSKPGGSCFPRRRIGSVLIQRG